MHEACHDGTATNPIQPLHCLPGKALALRCRPHACARACIQTEVKFKSAGQRGGRKAAGAEEEHDKDKDAQKVPFWWAAARTHARGAASMSTATAMQRAHACAHA